MLPMMAEMDIGPSTQAEKFQYLREMSVNFSPDLFY